MTYAYGMKNVPAVGQGLPGLPRREAGGNALPKSHFSPSLYDFGPNREIGSGYQIDTIASISYDYVFVAVLADKFVIYEREISGNRSLFYAEVDFKGETVLSNTQTIAGDNISYGASFASTTVHLNDETILLNENYVVTVENGVPTAYDVETSLQTPPTNQPEITFLRMGRNAKLLESIISQGDFVYFPCECTTTQNNHDRGVAVFNWKDREMAAVYPIIDEESSGDKIWTSAYWNGNPAGKIVFSYLGLQNSTGSGTPEFKVWVYDPSDGETYFYNVSNPSLPGAGRAVDRIWMKVAEDTESGLVCFHCGVTRSDDTRDFIQFFCGEIIVEADTYTKLVDYTYSTQSQNSLIVSFSHGRNYNGYFVEDVTDPLEAGAENQLRNVNSHPYFFSAMGKHKRLNGFTADIRVLSGVYVSVISDHIARCDIIENDPSITVTGQSVGFSPGAVYPTADLSQVVSFNDTYVTQTSRSFYFLPAERVAP